MTKIPPYWTNPKQSQFEVTIESVKRVDGHYHILINENVIRPAGGGQAGEKGLLNVNDESVHILDTIGNAECVVLVTDGALKEGTRGVLLIDMNWRSRMMRNHTAEHLFVSNIKKKIEDIDVGSIWIDGEHGSVELLGAEIDIDSVFDAELEVLRLIEEDLPVISHIVDTVNIDSSIRKREGLEDKHDQLRVVRVGDIDSSACSGIHVTRTGEIDFFKVIDVKTNQKTTHVEFMTGMAAGVRLSKSYNMAFRRRHSYPFEMEQLGAVLDKAKSAIDERQMLIEKVTQLLVSGSTIEHIGSMKYQYEFLPGYETGSLKLLANKLPLEESSIILLFTPGKKSQVLLKVNRTPLTASDYILKPLIQLGGKGGGKGEIFTGGFVDVENPLDLYNNLVNEVRKIIDKSAQVAELQ